MKQTLHPGFVFHHPARSNLPLKCFPKCQHFLMSPDEFLKSDPGSVILIVLKLFD